MSDDTLRAFLVELDALLAKRSRAAVPIVILGGAAMVLVHGGKLQTKDIDAMRSDHPRLKEALEIGGRNSPLHRKHGVFLEEVPDIYPRAPGVEKRAEVIDAGLSTMELRAFELHDVIVAKLYSFREEDKVDIRALTGSEKFSSRRLLERYRAAREELKFYWPDRLKTVDENFSHVRREILGLPPISFPDDAPGR